jgi:membrane-associated phospholipid phosphatase
VPKSHDFGYFRFSVPDLSRRWHVVNSGPNFGRLFRKTLAALLLCAALVLVCYLFIDRPVAFYVHDHGFSDYAFLKWLTEPPPILQAWTPVVITALMIRRVFGSFRRWELALLAASVSMVLGDQFRQSLSFVFGRDWPTTWIKNNPSLIGDGAYGFHFFHGSFVEGSFPSGHMTRTLSVAAIVWIAYPRWRWACVLGSVAEAVGLLGMNYHFVGDVIGGTFLGSIVGAYAACFSGLGEADDPTLQPTERELPC